MPEYIVNVREVHIQPYAVTADSPEEAMQIVEDGGGEIDEAGFEYSRTLGQDEWSVEEVKKKPRANTKRRA